MTTGNQIKKQVLAALEDDNFKLKIAELQRSSAKRVTNALFYLLLDPDETIRWRAVISMAASMDYLARKDLEAARVVMRRLMWSLNSESGGIGWGAPEVMAEVMARNEVLAEEYSAIFISYLDESGNFVEFEALQRGVLWGLARLAGMRPAMFESAGPLICKFLRSSDPTVRGLAARAAGLLKVQSCRFALQSLAKDDSELRVYVEPDLVNSRVSDLATEAISLLDGEPGPRL